MIVILTMGQVYDGSERQPAHGSKIFSREFRIPYSLRKRERSQNRPMETANAKLGTNFNEAGFSSAVLPREKCSKKLNSQEYENHEQLYPLSSVLSFHFEARKTDRVTGA